MTPKTDTTNYKRIERKNGMKIRTFSAPVPGGPETGMKIKWKMTGVF